jgi:hypothetical protein
MAIFFVFDNFFNIDMAVQNCIGDSYQGATSVSLHNGGGRDTLAIYFQLKSLRFMFVL